MAFSISHPSVTSFFDCGCVFSIGSWVTAVAFAVEAAVAALLDTKYDGSFSKGFAKVLSENVEGEGVRERS
jgi:hypothetical protein